MKRINQHIECQMADQQVAKWYFIANSSSGVQR
jgi:hypothetical protein